VEIFEQQGPTAAAIGILGPLRRHMDADRAISQRAVPTSRVPGCFSPRHKSEQIPVPRQRGEGAKCVVTESSSDPLGRLGLGAEQLPKPLPRHTAPGSSSPGTQSLPLPNRQASV
jgi:hypothetical protein